VKSRARRRRSEPRGSTADAADPNDRTWVRTVSTVIVRPARSRQREASRDYKHSGEARFGRQRERPGPRPPRACSGRGASAPPHPARTLALGQLVRLLDANHWAQSRLRVKRSAQQGVRGTTALRSPAVENRELVRRAPYDTPPASSARRRSTSSGFRPTRSPLRWRSCGPSSSARRRGLRERPSANRLEVWLVQRAASRTVSAGRSARRPRSAVVAPRPRSA
jgi:hypothetical protein